MSSPTPPPDAAAAVAPSDPRRGWDLPPLGALAPVVELDPTLTRVLAPNPGPMTLDGTNTYVVGAPGSGVAAVVDPGPDDPAHLAAVESVLAGRDATVAAVLVTHHHADHLEAAAPWAARFGCRVHAGRREDVGPDGVVLADGDRVDLPGLELRTVATPGHTREHLAFRPGTGAVLTGDHLLGRGTTVVTHPDGDIVAYLASLERLLDLDPPALHPGHGPSLLEDPAAVVRYHLDHRAYRRSQVLAALGDGPATPPELVARIYHDVDRGLWPAAESSTRALLDALVREGRVTHRDADVVRLTA